MGRSHEKENRFWRQIRHHYNDPILLNYLEAIITTGVDMNAMIVLPEKGIPLRTRTPHGSCADEEERAENQVWVAVHARTCRRALDRVKALRGDAVYPAKIRRYLGPLGDLVASYGGRTNFKECVGFRPLSSVIRLPIG